MPAEIEMLKILQVVLLVAFLSVTGLFLVLSLAKRRRLKGVLVWVPTGWVFGVPVRPILFVVVLVAILTTGILAGGRVSPYLISGYLAGAVLWGTATCLSTSVFVLDFGIVRGLVDKTDYLPWSWVEDYFVHEGRRHRTLYVFLYRNEDGRQRRFEVQVPRSRREQFSEVVDDILEARFTARRQRSRSRRRVKGV